MTQSDLKLIFKLIRIVYSLYSKTGYGLLFQIKHSHYNHVNNNNLLQYKIEFDCIYLLVMQPLDPLINNILPCYVNRGMI